MARPVTMQELTDWVKKNEGRTWSHEYEPQAPEWHTTMEMKYIRFNLDTRDMKVFTVTTNLEAINADFRESFDGTILELLETKLGPKPTYGGYRPEVD